MTMAPRSNDCFPARIRRADQHLASGEWASSHAIASALLQCSAQGGCHEKTLCAGAASTLICRLRGLLGH